MFSFYKVDKKEKIIPQVLSVLYQQKIQSVLVEGGAKLLQSFIDENLWDEARVITNVEMVIGKGIDAPVLANKKLMKKEISGTDKIEYFFKQLL